MAPAASNKPQAPRKRIRKRKRRAASSSESSSSDTDSDASDASGPSTSKAGAETVAPVSASTQKTKAGLKGKGESSSESEEGSDDSSSSSDSSSGSDSDSDSDGGVAKKKGRTAVVLKADDANAAGRKTMLPPSRSPTPPAVPLPSFLPSTRSDATTGLTQLQKEKFRQLYMASIAEGFKDDLEQIRKEPNLGKSRLGLLIDSLASGAEVFTTPSSSSSERRLDAMDVIMTDEASSTS